MKKSQQNNNNNSSILNEYSFEEKEDVNRSTEKK